MPDDLNLSVEIAEESRPMCCQGCAAVARAIVESGLERYYQNRTASAQRGEELVPEALRELAIYDNAQVQSTFVHRLEGASREVSLILEGITCAACVWLNEQHLQRLSGIEEVQVNYSNNRAFIRWDDSRIQLSDILEAIRAIGYDAHPYDPSQRQQLLDRERKRLLRQLGVAGVFGMQVMLLAVSIYASAWTGMDADMEAFFRKMSLLLTLPVVFYSATQFFRNAWTDLRHRRAGMDVPVSLGILLAFAASIWAVVSGEGEIYFDSVCMFTFLLLAARYLELAVRKRAADAADVIGHAQPAAAKRLLPDGSTETVPAVELRPGHLILVQPGEIVPSDGLIREGSSSVDEAILTGESIPIARGPGEKVIGGSINTESPLTVEVTEVGQDTVISGIQRLLDRAQAEKPESARMADRIAGWFILFVLLLAASVGLVWYRIDAENWLSPTIAVLIVSCPCALSLATPAAITAAVGRLMRHGILIGRGHALETLTRVQRFFFDKTGTLTSSVLKIEKVQTLADSDINSCLQLAAALERYSEHPIARVFSKAVETKPPAASEVENQPGAGLRGRIAGCEVFVGTPAFVAAETHLELSEEILEPFAGLTLVVLAKRQRLLCLFGLSDTPRNDAAALVFMLKKRGIAVGLLSGDRKPAALRIAQQVGIDPADVEADFSPEQKLAVVRQCQQAGETVAMVGDGINDAAVLGGAALSIAMPGAAPLAAAGADIVLLSPRLLEIDRALDIAHRTARIIKQNLSWALGYNLIAIPAAALGYVPPWLAAVGMSASSLIVALNALRLRKD